MVDQKNVFKYHGIVVVLYHPALVPNTQWNLAQVAFTSITNPNPRGTTLHMSPHHLLICRFVVLSS